jgi:hypothetical protein
MTKEQQEFVNNLYTKMLEGYFDIDDFKKAFSYISESKEAQANVQRMRRTIAAHVNLNNLKEANKNDNEPTNKENHYTNLEDAIGIDNLIPDTDADGSLQSPETIQLPERKTKNKGGRPKKIKE